MSKSLFITHLGVRKVFVFFPLGGTRTEKVGNHWYIAFSLTPIFLFWKIVFRKKWSNLDFVFRLREKKKTEMDTNYRKSGRFRTLHNFNRIENARHHDGVQHPPSPPPRTCPACTTILTKFVRPEGSSNNNVTEGHLTSYLLTNIGQITKTSKMSSISLSFYESIEFERILVNGNGFR